MTIDLAANTARGTARFVDELAARVRRAGASGEDPACRFGVLVGQDDPGLPPPPDPLLDHRAADQANPNRDSGDRPGRLGRHRLPRRGPGAARRDPLPGRPADRAPHPPGRRPGRAVPTWRYHAFVTDRVGTTVWLDAGHRRHAVVELCIRDLKAGVGLRHHPSGRFAANAAWLVIATLAHNTLLALPGRITRSVRRLVLHLPVG
jgi:hypothetical protein